MKKIFNIIFKTKIRIGVTLFAIAGIALAFTFGPHYKFLHIKGESMSPTIEHGEWVSARRDTTGMVLYSVIAIKDGRGELLAKRIIAMEGDTVEVIEGVIYINNKLLEDPYGHGRITFYCQKCRQNEYISHSKEVIPEDHVWVIGDNRAVSWYGLLPLSNVEGIISTR